MEKKFTKRELYDALIGKLCGEEVEVDAQTLVDFVRQRLIVLISVTPRTVRSVRPRRLNLMLLARRYLPQLMSSFVLLM